MTDDATPREVGSHAGLGPDSQQLVDACEQRLPLKWQAAIIDKLDNLRAALAEPDTCTWHQDGDIDSGVYSTSCRRYFNLEDGTPEDNKMAWCCYCGKKLAQELITEDEDA
jgi:hypothetical protein